MTRRIAFALLALVLLAGGACGGDDDDSSSSTTGSPETSSSAGSDESSSAGSEADGCQLEDGLTLERSDLDECSPSDFAPASYDCKDGGELLATDDGYVELVDDAGVWHDGPADDALAVCIGSGG